MALAGRSACNLGSVSREPTITHTRRPVRKRKMGSG
jgi:hypothetical protein